MGVVDAAPLMQAAFDAHAVDESVRGDWEDVQIALRLLEERVTPPPPPWAGRLAVRDLPSAPAAPPKCGKTARTAKDRRAAAKQARKRNRGR